MKTTRERPFPQPISILKPVKGIDGNLRQNLESFFQLQYIRFEILFSVTEETDPAVPIIRSLIEKYPAVNARLIIANHNIGLNPKVNNLAQSYSEAQYEWVLISDSNIWVDSQYLFAATEHFTSDVGVVTAVVSGREPQQLGAWLEAVFLNTFYARWMFLARELGNPAVIGKSMLFRKSDAERFGGLKTLSLYLAEDYMAGVSMVQLNRRIEIMSQPVIQPLGEYSFKTFWSRHIRWGRIRKSQAPLVFTFEPLLTFWVSGLLGAASLNGLFGLPVLVTIGIHTAIWLASDLVMMNVTQSGLGWRSCFIWLLRETLYIPMWIHIAAGRTVLWRGRKLTLARGGLLES